MQQKHNQPEWGQEGVSDYRWAGKQIGQGGVLCIRLPSDPSPGPWFSPMA